jgi:hypothetical protein
MMAFLVSAPVLLFPLLNKDVYAGINIANFGSDEYFYLSRGKEVLENNSLGNIYSKEGKADQDPFFSYAENIMLVPIMLLGLSDKAEVVDIYNFYNFVGVFLLIILIYILALQLSGDKLLSVLTAVFVVGGYSIIYYKALFFTDFNEYGRSPNPYLGLIFLFSYLNLLIRSLRTPKLIYKIFAGIFFGIIFYIYFYTWTFVLVFNGLLLLIYLLKKNFSCFKTVLTITISGLILGSYNLVKFLLFLGSDASGQLSYFNRSSYGYIPILSKIGLVTLVLFLFYSYKKKEDSNKPLILSLILSGWVALNQQLVTGRMLQIGHYYWYIIVPISIVIGFYMIWSLIDNLFLRKLVFVFFLVLAFVNTVGGQYKSIPTVLVEKRYEQNYRPIIDFLKKDTESKVILAAEDTNEYLYLIYTNHDVFWHSIEMAHGASLHNLKDALFVYLYLNKNSRQDFAGYLNNSMSDEKDRSFYKNIYLNWEGYASGFDYYEYMNKFKDNAGIKILREKLINDFYKEYRDRISSEGVLDILNKYGVNYLVWDKNKYPEWDISSLNNLAKVFEFNNIFIYKLKGV